MVTAKYYDRFPQIKDHQERVYAAMVAALDDNVGKVLDAVRASGQAGSTLIVFASDNGCAAYFPGLCSCWPLRGGKLSYYEGGIRVPFMVRRLPAEISRWSSGMIAPKWPTKRPATYDVCGRTFRLPI
jgi:arylsulfatase A-like enzyme